MEVLTVEQDISLVNFWKSLIPTQGAEKPWLFYEGGKKRVSFTWKDARAQAHCVAAYLMDKGLRKGDAVGILSSSSPFYIVVDLALQFLGAENITLPQDISLKALQARAGKESFKFFFVESAETFLRLDQLKSLRANLKEIVLEVDDAEGLEPEKLVTFDRVVTLGKVPWREQLQEFNAMKDAVVPDKDHYCQDREGKPITFKEMMDRCDQAGEFLRSNQIQTLLSLHSPESLVHRAFAYFAPMRLKLHSWCKPGTDFSFDLLKEIQPQVIVLSPALLDGLYATIEAHCNTVGGSMKRGLAKSHKVRDKRNKFLKEGQKVPLFTRMAFKNLQRGFFGKLRKSMGNNLRILLVEKGGITPGTRAFFVDMGLEIREE